MLQRCVQLSNGQTMITLREWYDDWIPIFLRGSLCVWFTECGTNEIANKIGVRVAASSGSSLPNTSARSALRSTPKSTRYIQPASSACSAYVAFTPLEEGSVCKSIGMAEETARLHRWALMCSWVVWRRRVLYKSIIQRATGALRSPSSPEKWLGCPETCAWTSHTMNADSTRRWGVRMYHTCVHLPGTSTAFV